MSRYRGGRGGRDDVLDLGTMVVWRTLTVALIVAAAVELGGCLGTLRADPAAEAVALTPEPELALPRRESHRHWLLRGEPGWCGGQEVRFGGDPEDPAVATVRAVTFRTGDSAIRAFGRLTPAYLYSVLRGRMTALPRPLDYPEPLAGDEVLVFEYDVRLPVIISPDVTVFGQLTVIRAARVVVLVESIGVPPEQLVPAIREITRSANRLPADGC